MTLNDLILAVTAGDTVNEGLSSWYSRTADESLTDAERRWLIGKGATPGSINDMWFQFLRTSGYTGALNDMKYDYWLSGPVPDDPTEDPVELVLVAGQTSGAPRFGYRLGVAGELDPSSFLSGFTITRLDTRADQGNIYLYNNEVVEEFYGFIVGGVGGFEFLRTDAIYNGTDRWRWDFPPGFLGFEDGETYALTFFP